MDISTVFSFFGIGFFVSWVTIPLIIRRFLNPEKITATREFHHTHKEPISRFGGRCTGRQFSCRFSLCFLMVSQPGENIFAPGHFIYDPRHVCARLY